MPRFVDLSVAIDNNEHTDHPGGAPKVTYRNHAQTAGGLAHFFPGLEPEDLPDGEAKTARVALHISIGLLVLLFGLARLAWRLANGLPRPAGDHARWERSLARVVHIVLLVAPIYMPLAGMLLAFGEGYAVGLFGLTLIPASTEVPEALGEIGHVLHGLGGGLLSLAILLHLGGALKHHFWDRDGTFRRMLGGTLITVSDRAKT